MLASIRNLKPKSFEIDLFSKHFPWFILNILTIQNVNTAIKFAPSNILKYIIHTLNITKICPHALTRLKNVQKVFI